MFVLLSFIYKKTINNWDFSIVSDLGFYTDAYSFYESTIIFDKNIVTHVI